jgi:hypothetical protein
MLAQPLPPALDRRLALDVVIIVMIVHGLTGNSCQCGDCGEADGGVGIVQIGDQPRNALGVVVLRGVFYRWNRAGGAVAVDVFRILAETAGKPDAGGEDDDFPIHALLPSEYRRGMRGNWNDGQTRSRSTYRT